MELDHRLVDLDTRIERDASVRLVTTQDPVALEIMRHSRGPCHGQAILRLYPDAKLTIGPVVEEGFYYDIDMPPVSEETSPRSRPRSRRSSRPSSPSGGASDQGRSAGGLPKRAL